jgi:hypothetical protein
LPWQINRIPSCRNVTPQALINAGAPVYDWDKDKFGDWVEEAYKKSQEKKEAVAKAGRSW